MDDKEQFAERFFEIEKELYRIAFIYLKNREDALDCVQETALRCCKGYKNLRQPEFFKTWAVRIAINCATDILRKRGVELSFDDIEPAAEQSESAEDEVIDRVTLSDLLSKLSVSERGVFVLRHAYGYSFAEIAELLGIPNGTAKSTCYRAIEKLKKEDLR